MIQKIGKKGREWIKARVRLIKEAVLAGKIRVIDNRVVGNCEDCGHWHNLTPDHRKKRTQGGKHIQNNINWVCNEAPCFCHHKIDNMPDSKKQKGKKTAWQNLHQCKHCKSKIYQLICPNCGEMSL